VIHLKGLPLPCTLNSMYGVMPIPVKGRIIFKKVLTKRARERRKLFMAAIHEQLGGPPVPMTGAVQVTYTITPRDRRTPDVDAYEKSLLDCLQHAGVYLNDSQVVQCSKERLEPKFPGGIDVQINEVPE
jgi:crossover junction endodeoxyribonuclease RusA